MSPGSGAAAERRRPSAEPVGSEEFERLMAPFGPFEDRPRIAAAVSGGADSLALALLLHDWTAARGGRLQVLTVDHGLRPEAAAEARQVKHRLQARGIAHRILRWEGPRPATGLQAAAREARYALLRDWCGRHGVLHLALAHQRDDQAETVMLRLGRDSGPDGLAGMAALVELPELRLLRPLLALPKARLEATVAARGLDWIADPSNRDPSFARVRLRRLLPRLAAAGLPPERFAETARVLGRARATRETALARLLVRALALDPLGYGWLDPEVLRAASADLSRRALARCLVTIGGLAYAPRRARLERLHRRILAESGSDSPAGLGRGATLGGCCILPRGGRLLVVREAGRAETLDFGRVRERLWDGRFRLSLTRPAGDTGVELGPLGTAGRTALRAEGVEIAPGGLPAPACAALPALRDAKGLVAVPNLGYRRPGTGIPRVAACRFAPRNPLCGGAFTVA